MAEVQITQVVPGATQTETELVLPKAGLHPTLVATANNSLEQLLAALLWKILESGIFTEEAQEGDPDRNLVLTEGDDRTSRDFVTDDPYLVRSVEVALREPYVSPGFSAANY